MSRRGAAALVQAALELRGLCDACSDAGGAGHKRCSDPGCGCMCRRTFAVAGRVHEAPEGTPVAPRHSSPAAPVAAVLPWMKYRDEAAADGEAPAVSVRIVGKSERAGGGVRVDVVSLAHLPTVRCEACGGARPAGDGPHAPQNTLDGSGDVRDCAGRRWRREHDAAGLVRYVRRDGGADG